MPQRDPILELFNLSADLLCVADLEGYFRVLSPAFERTLGFTLAELQAKPFVEFVHPEDRDATISELEGLRRGQTTLRFENRYQCKDGTYRWLEWTCRPDIDSGLCYAVARDATKRKEMEQRLREAEQSLRESHETLENQYEAVVRASGQLLYDWNPTTDEVTYGNSEKALGYRPEDLEGGLERWVELIHPEDRKSFRDEVEHVTATTRSFHLEYRVRRASGDYVDLEDRGYFFRSAEDNVARMIGFRADVTERKELEEQLRQAQKMEAIGRLSGGLAHDFNNLLSVIIGYCDLTLRDLGDDSDSLRSSIEEIRRAGELGGALTKQLLAFSRHQVLQPDVLDVGEVLLDMDGMLRRLLGENIHLEVRLAVDLDRVLLDRGQLEQILLNLAANARDAMPRGGTLRITTENRAVPAAAGSELAGAAAGDYVLLTVHDTGGGMDATTAARVFDPFFTTKQPAGGESTGTGLGLATVYGIVTQSGGTITVDTAPGAGCTFRVLLPRTERSPTRRKVEEVTPPVETAAGTILVVEDNTALRNLIVRVLDAEGFSTLHADSAEQALQQTADLDEPIDLLLTDVVLPGVDGRQLAENLKSRRPDLKVLYMSGYADNALAECPEREALEFLQKPVAMPTLLRKVRELLP